MLRAGVVRLWDVLGLTSDLHLAGRQVCARVRAACFAFGELSFLIGRLQGYRQVGGRTPGISSFPQAAALPGERGAVVGSCITSDPQTKNTPRTSHTTTLSPFSKSKHVKEQACGRERKVPGRVPEEVRRRVSSGAGQAGSAEDP